MAHWLTELNLAPEYHSLGDDYIKLAGVIADRLDALTLPASAKSNDREKESLSDEFRYMSCCADIDVYDFDELMSRLYDWADTSLDKHLNGKKLCWIKTQKEGSGMSDWMPLSDAGYSIQEPK